jgi:hypothetical protein
VVPIGGDTWTFSTSDHPEIEFCVWALQRDGLRAPPFDLHADGDGELRSAGLTADAWSAWLAGVVGEVASLQERRQADFTQGMERFFIGLERPPTPQEMHELAVEPRPERAAVELWAGAPGVGERLGELRDEYRTWRSRRESEMREVVQAGLAELSARPDTGNRLWRAIQRYRPLPPLWFFMVDYPDTVLAVVPPASAVLGGIHPVVGLDAAYEPMVLEAAERLSEAGRG